MCRFRDNAVSNSLAELGVNALTVEDCTIEDNNFTAGGALR